MKAATLCLFSGLILLPNGAIKAASDAWQQIRDKDGISIYKRAIPDSRLLAFRAVSTIEADGDHIIAVMNDVDEHIHVTPGLVDLEVLREVSDFERIEYLLFKMPWPFKSRFAIIRSTLERLPDGSIEMKMESVDEPYNKVTGHTQGQVNFANISLKPVEGTPGHWHTIVEASVDPKGSIPKFMINWVFKEWPYQFLSRLDKRIGLYAARQTGGGKPSVAGGEPSPHAVPEDRDAS